MATVEEYYKKDFSHCFRVHNNWKLVTKEGEVENEILASVHFNFESNTKFYSFYLPICESPIDLMVMLFKKLAEVDNMLQGLEISTAFPHEFAMQSGELKYSRRIFYYYQGEFPNKEINDLHEMMINAGHYAIFRDINYAKERSAKEQPLAFISHDHRDKEEVASKLALQLQKFMCPVWYDEYSLKIGDSLRESIEKGVRECHKCILILSPNYLFNQGWTKAEFNAIFTREILENKKLILPVWFGVSKKELFEYSPTLADRVGVDWNIGCENVARKIIRSFA